MKADVVSAIQNLEVANRQQESWKPSIINNWNKSTERIYTLEGLMKYLYQFSDQYNKAMPNLSMPLVAIKAQYQAELMQEQRSMPKAQMGTPTVKRTPRTKTLTPQQKKVIRWQQRYNAAVKGSGLPKLVVDGAWGKNTKAAYENMRETGAKSFGEFAAALKRSDKSMTGRKPIEPAELALEPIPPPAAPMNPYQMERKRKMDLLDKQLFFSKINPQHEKIMEILRSRKKDKPGTSARVYEILKAQTHTPKEILREFSK